MFSKHFVRKTLQKGKPNPKVLWFGEPNLGSHYDEKEINAVIKVLENSKHWSIGFGPNPIEIKNFENDFAKYCNVKHAVAVSNNGDAFDMVLNTLNLKPEDEIITPALNFKAWHMIILRFNCKVVFVDIDIKTLNVDIDDLRKKITKNTKVICPVHLSGLSCDINEIDQIAREKSIKNKNKIFVIYDSARATGANYKKKKVGFGGHCEIFSFHTAKLMTTLGEGGMITTNDDELADKLNKMRSYGGEEMWGMNYRMSKISAVFGIEQLKKLDILNNLRIKNAKRREANLEGCKNLIFPSDTNYSEHIYYLHTLMLTDKHTENCRDKIINRLHAEYGIVCSVPKFINERWNYIKKKFKTPVLKNTSYVTAKLICPIMHPKITEEQEDYISSALIHVIG